MSSVEYIRVEVDGEHDASDGEGDSRMSISAASRRDTYLRPRASLVVFPSHPSDYRQVCLIRASDRFSEIRLRRDSRMAGPKARDREPIQGWKGDQSPL